VFNILNHFILNNNKLDNIVQMVCESESILICKIVGPIVNLSMNNNQSLDDVNRAFAIPDNIIDYNVVAGHFDDSYSEIIHGIDLNRRRLLHNFKDPSDCLFMNYEFAPFFVHCKDSDQMTAQARVLFSIGDTRLANIDLNINSGIIDSEDSDITIKFLLEFMDGGYSFRNYFAFSEKINLLIAAFQGLQDKRPIYLTHLFGEIKDG